ncbi:hypothetical protein HK100_005046 [Physocladia obscura]|uniref:Polymerase nucleotidyl transferase domain-containing protein n=1 Tax=Physocladia obscura TaxID=109957 RepID=A0AAD5TC80_9FUNG|nr:hypothetical protein HK100_005046 [Physocladia obscura]
MNPENITALKPVECICCPTTTCVAAPFDGAIRRLVFDLHAEFGADLLAILVTGSLVTGNFHINSDIDLFAIIKQHKRQRRLFQLSPSDFIPPPSTTSGSSTPVGSQSASTVTISYGAPRAIQCEVFINPFHRMKEEIAALEDPSVNAWRLGHVLYEVFFNDTNVNGNDDGHNSQDIQNPASYLKAFATQTHEAGKPNGTTWTNFKRDMTRYMLMDGLLDAWDAIEAGDAASGSIMISRGLTMALDALYESRGWWGVKPKKRLLDLKENKQLYDIKANPSPLSSSLLPTNNDARRALQLSRRIARDDLELVERFKALKTLVALVVEPLGGEMEDWVTDWESTD